MRRIVPQMVVVLGLGVAVLLSTRGRAQEGTRPIFFVRDVAPIFDQMKCSSAPCHGKFTGQGRLQLSLMTLSPTYDFKPLEPLIELDHPADSLLLQKPTLDVPHGGGKRFGKSSPEYRTLLTWIQQGCRNPDREPLPTSIEVSPSRVVFNAERTEAQVKVTATFADGETEDVTDRSVFLSQDTDLATVTPEGLVTPGRWGMTAVVCRYVGLVKPVFVITPRPAQPDDPAGRTMSTTNPIDQLVARNLERLGIQPSPVCDDYAFLRRTSLSLVGALPRPDEISAFVADQDPDKRANLVDRLMADQRFVDLRTLHVGDMLRINPTKLANGPLQNRAAMVFDIWVRDQIQKNEPYDQFARDLLTADGSTMLNGPANFYRVERSPQDRAETVAQAFLGIRLACARCHNHPFDRWTTDDYWQFAAFMVKVRERSGELYNEGVIYHDNKAGLRNDAVTSPKRGQIAPPTFLGAESLDSKYDGDYVNALADWIIGADNPYFAIATANRIWSHFMGQGVIEPVDDIRETSVDAVPGLLALLAYQLKSTSYDTKALIRLICTSETFQLGAQTNPTNGLDNRFFSHYRPKQMLAQVLLDAINQACGTTDRFGNFPAGTRAVELPLPERNEFLDKFGRAGREFLAELDPHVEPTLPQTLHMINSPYINQKVGAKDGVVAQLEPQTADDQALITALYLRTVCRPPSEDEVHSITAYLNTVSNRREAYEDLLWALITSREFLFVS